MIAQEVQKILPDAVSSSGPYLLNNGELIDDMLIVDKDRLFLGENLILSIALFNRFFIFGEIALSIYVVVPKSKT